MAKQSKSKTQWTIGLSIPPVAQAEITHEMISQRARELWEKKGKPTGQDEQIWLEAEAELKKPQAKR